MNQLSNKVAIITGASSGIGQDAARLFASEGARLVVTGRRQAALEALVGEIAAKGGEAVALAGDIRDEQLARRLVELAVDRFGGLDEENFAVAYNDVDFCLRLWQSGLLNVMTPFAAAVHHESKSRGDDTRAGGEKQARYEREKARFCARYAGLMQQGDPYYNPHFTLLYENYGYK